MRFILESNLAFLRDTFRKPIGLPDSLYRRIVIDHIVVGVEWKGDGSDETTIHVHVSADGMTEDSELEYHIPSGIAVVCWETPV